MEHEFKKDVFICHASEDKEEFVSHLARLLQKSSVRVWYDEFSMGWGDNLMRSIDKGLSSSRFGIVVLSEHFFQKGWTVRELGGLWSREVKGEKVILPIWHNVKKEDVERFSPMLVDKVALDSSKHDLDEIVRRLVQLVQGGSGIDEDRTQATPLPLSLGDLIRMGEPDASKQLQHCSSLARHNRMNADAQMALGVVLLYLQQFQEAATQFAAAIKVAPYVANAHYYRALALLRGRRPKTLSLSEARQMLEYAEHAIRLEPSRAIFDSFMAIIKHDYYAMNAVGAPPPNATEHIRRAKGKIKDAAELEGLLSLVTLRDPELVAAIRQ